MWSYRLTYMPKPPIVIWHVPTLSLLVLLNYEWLDHMLHSQDNLYKILDFCVCILLSTLFLFPTRSIRSVLLHEFQSCASGWRPQSLYFFGVPAKIYEAVPRNRSSCKRVNLFFLPVFTRLTSLTVRVLSSAQKTWAYLNGEQSYVQTKVLTLPGISKRVNVINCIPVQVPGSLTFHCLVYQFKEFFVSHTDANQAFEQSCPWLESCTSLLESCRFLF